MKNIGVAVINLDRRVDRIEYMRRTLDSFGVNFHKVSAVDAGDNKNSWLTEGGWSHLSGRSMTRGEHAVHASHYKVWKDALDRKLDAVIVLEDDLIISKDIAHLLDSDWIPEDADIIKLESHWGEIELGPVCKKLNKNRNLRRMFSLHLGAAGYLVTFKGLNKLIKIISPNEIKDPLDWALFDRRSSVFQKLVVYQIEPAPVVQMKFFEDEDNYRLVRSDLSKDRDVIKGSAKLKNYLSFHIRFARKFIIRGRSWLRGRHRLKVPYRD